MGRGVQTYGRAVGRWQHTQLPARLRLLTARLHSPPCSHHKHTVGHHIAPGTHWARWPRPRCLTSSLNTTHSAFLPHSTEEGWMATVCPVAITL